LKTTRLFSLQLADYDAGYGPHLKRPKSKLRFLKLLIFIPALVLLIFPSFRLARPVYQAPPFEVPDTLNHGDLFTFPEEEDILNPTAGGKAMVRVDKSNPILLAAVPAGPTFEVSFIFGQAYGQSAKDKKRIKLHWPRLEHPIYRVFSKVITVKDESQPVAGSASSVAKAAASTASALESKLIFSRVDGTADLTCWKAPALKSVALSESFKRRHGAQKLRIKMATVSAVGPGEVIYAGASGGTLGSTGQTLVIYHGSGLYSRFTDLRETSVRKGDRVKIGQEVAVVAAVNAKTPLSVKWSAFLEGQELNSQNLLALSSQLCDSK
jgi:hypothetical protein